MAIGSCDNCDRKDVPVANYETPHGDTTQCFICTAPPWVKDPDPDPYGELEGAPHMTAANCGLTDRDLPGGIFDDREDH